MDLSMYRRSEARGRHDLVSLFFDRATYSRGSRARVRDHPSQTSAVTPLEPMLALEFIR